MSRMTIFQLGVFVFALCLTTQVFSQNITGPGNTTMSTNTTTTATNTYSSSANTTSPTGAGVSLQASSAALLTPLLIVLLRFC